MKVLIKSLAQLIKIITKKTEAPEQSYPPISNLEKQVVNTTWAPDNAQDDSSIHFFDTKTNDPQNLHFDYQTASDTETREIGFWKETNGAIILIPTKIITDPTNLNKAVIKGSKLFLYWSGSSKPTDHATYIKYF